MTEAFWRRCSSCKRGIGFDTKYWVCSVTTCSRKGSTFVFCSVPCWDAHVPIMRHREAWVEEQRSPTREAWAGRVSEGREANAPVRSSSVPAPSPAPPHATGDIPHDVLIVASKLKKYVRARSGMNTSDSVMEILSRRVRALCDDAILRAQEDGRKTVLDRDF